MLYSVSVTCKFWTTVFRGIGSPMWSVVTKTLSPGIHMSWTPGQRNKDSQSHRKMNGSENRLTMYRTRSPANPKNLSRFDGLVAYETVLWGEITISLDLKHLCSYIGTHAPGIFVRASSTIDTLPASRSISPKRVSCSLRVAVCFSTLQRRGSGAVTALQF